LVWRRRTEVGGRDKGRLKAGAEGWVSQSKQRACSRQGQWFDDGPSRSAWGFLLAEGCGWGYDCRA
jgi:hypothetical protein